MYFYLPSISPLSLFLEEPPRLLFEFLEDVLGLEPALPEGLARQEEEVRILYLSHKSNEEEDIPSYEQSRKLGL